MPTYFNVSANWIVEYILNTKQYDRIDQYINENILDDSEFVKGYKAFWEQKKRINYNNDRLESDIYYYNMDTKKKKLYYLLVNAVDLDDLHVIELFRDQIDVDYITDGNDYYLIHLVLDNYEEYNSRWRKEYKRQDTKMLDLLLDIARKKGCNLDTFKWYFERSAHKIIYAEKCELIDYVVNFDYALFNVDREIVLKNMYITAIDIQQPKLVKYMIIHYGHILNLKGWTNEVLNEAYNERLLDTGCSYFFNRFGEKIVTRFGLNRLGLGDSEIYREMYKGVNQVYLNKMNRIKRRKLHVNKFIEHFSNKDL